MTGAAGTAHPAAAVIGPPSRCMQAASGARVLQQQSADPSNSSSNTPRTAQMFATVPMNKRAAAWIDKMDIGLPLDLLSATLSLLTVITYMVETNFVPNDPVSSRLQVVDLVCSCLFAVEWCFWLWLAHDRLRYIGSIQSLVDIVTVVPMFVSFFVNSHLPGFALFSQLVRILRALRVFRIFRLGKRLKNEVQACLLTLLFTLLALIFVTAGLFYELETTYGDSYPDLTMQQAIYYSVVTSTTIGYGDFSPSLPASQLSLVAMLVITFAILPYQTSALVSALQARSIYLAAHYNQTARGRHVVIAGQQLSAAQVCHIIEEFFHEDHGHHDFSVCLLSPEAPGDAMRRLLKVHKQAHKMLYIQGSCLSQQDLARAQVEHCDALFILCSHQPEQAAQEDLMNTQACLAVGQYLQMHEQSRGKRGPKPLGQRLALLLKAVLMRLQPRKHYLGRPRVVVQLLLPESQQLLQGLVEAYAFPPGLAAEPAEPTGLAPGDSSSGSSSFWQAFGQNIMPQCVTELRLGLLGLSLGCPGAGTLVSNLVRSVDSRGLPAGLFEQLPEWMQQYLEGSANELYELGSFPEHLVGQPVWLAAAYLQHQHRACLIATSGTTAAPSGAGNGTQQQQQPDAATGTVISSFDKRPAEASSTAPAPEAEASAAASRIDLASMDGTITAGTMGFVIAADLRVVAEVMEEPGAAFQAWLQQQQAAGRLTALADEAAAAGAITGQHVVAAARWQMLLAESTACGAAAAPTVKASSLAAAGPFSAGRRHTADAVLCGSSAPGVVAEVSAVKQPAGLPSVSEGEGKLQLLAASGCLLHEPSSDGGACSPDSALDANSAPNSHKENRNLRGLSTRSLVSLVPSSLAGLPLLLAAGDSSGSSARRRHRGAIMLTSPTKTNSGILHLCDVAAAVQDMQQSGGGRRRHTLSSASSSRLRRALLDQQLQAAYHTRPLAPPPNELQELVCSEVDCSDHILIFSNSTPPSALFCLLAALRSVQTAAAECRPVVIVGCSQPLGPEWQSIARLQQVFHIQGDSSRPETLLCANAEAAAQAVLLRSWSPAGSLALQDATVMATARQLKALNADMQVFVELNQQESLLLLDPLGSLLDLSCGVAAAAAATPAFMSGGVLLPGLVDSMLCQALYFPGIPKLLSKMLARWHSGSMSAAVPSGHVAAGDAGGPWMMTAGLARLQQLPIGDCAAACGTFGELFQRLLRERRGVCVALYRRAVHHGRALRFVTTNPDRRTVLRETDCAIVLLREHCE